MVLDKNISNKLQPRLNAHKNTLTNENDLILPGLNDFKIAATDAHLRLSVIFSWFGGKLELFRYSPIQG